MKHLPAFTSALALVFAGAGLAGAQGTPSPVVIEEIRGYAPDADLSALTPAQIGVLQTIIHGNDDEGRITRDVRNYLRKIN